MVTYHKWTSIAFAEAKAQGYDTSVAQNNADLISLGAQIWQDRKNELETATEPEAENIAREEITVTP